ncbi:MAG: hypothetical protein A2X86_22230 [Bdellovibrionales bacterium GWA2_49_15]|nr:MAG: hypothetical protein A2X86_22230 [Bdellovibrionales bacterium GWA2_49_15]HAZ14803.1 hypothetical protein [Bdellovibrionales bacterium]
MGIFFGRNREDQNAPATTEANQSSRARVIAFLNQKGGVGKTTCAFNTAHALAKRGHKVLCLDMDPQANLSLLFNVDLSLASEEDSAIPGPYSIYHLLVNSVRELKALHVGVLLGDVLVSRGGIDLLPAGQELSGFELTVASVTTPRQLILKRFLEKQNILEQYDYILADCPPTLGLTVINVLCAAQGILVPFRPDEFSKKGLEHLEVVLQDVAEMGISQIPEVIGHIPNLVDSRRKQEELDLTGIGELLKTTGHQKDGLCFDPLFNRSQLVKAQASKKSVFDYDSKEYAPLQEQFGTIASTIEKWNLEHSHGQ